MTKQFVTLLLAAMCGVVQASADAYFTCGFGEAMPADFVTVDNDAAELYFTMQQLGFSERDSWTILREEGSMNYYAASASRFKVAKGETAPAANDWMITPAVWIKGSGACLTWRAMTYNERNANTASYSVYVSESGQSMADFTDAPIATIDSEALLKWTDHSVDLSAYEGKRVYIAFVNTSYDSDVLAIDDINVEGDAGFASIDITPGAYATGGEMIEVTATITALSGEPINSVSLGCTVNGNTDDVWTIERSGLNIAAGESLSFTFPGKIEASYGDQIALHITARVNDVVFDPINQTTTVLAFLPTKRIVVEEVTGMWCGYCPKGVIAMETLAENYPDSFIGIAVHQGDKLQVDGYGDTMEFPEGAPTGWIDRVIYNANPMTPITSAGKQTYTTLMGGFETSFLERLADQAMADVDVEATLNDSREINVKVSASFAVNLKDVDYRVVLVLTEDDVWREGYYQTNYFAGSPELVFGYEMLPDKIYDVRFDHVARAVCQSYQGISGSLPPTLAAGSQYVYETTWPLPATIIDDAKTHVVAMVVDASTGEVLNANTCAYAGSDPASADAVATPELSVTMDGGVVNVSGNGNVSLSVADIAGRSVLATAGSGQLSVDLSSFKGLYIITIADDSAATRTLKVSL